MSHSQQRRCRGRLRAHARRQPQAHAARWQMADRRMSMKRATLVCAVLALAGTGAVIWQQRSLAELRRPHGSLGFTDAATMDDNNAEQREVLALREQTKDLPRLRNEVTQLRAHRAELDAARRERE